MLKSSTKVKCCWLVTLVVVKNLCGQLLSVDMLSRICVYSYISHILCIPSIVSGIFVALVYVICNNGVYDIL